jgi:ubiquinone/menaquinone biosynthesis C-methylase UbiE
VVRGSIVGPQVVRQNASGALETAVGTRFTTHVRTTAEKQNAISCRSMTEEAYDQWQREVHGGAQGRRSMERNGAFLLPHLRAGMRVLDAGCGPGSITVGIAAAVAPGEAVGVDTSPDAIASAMSRETAPSTIHFALADATALPFDRGAFDAAFAHAILQHIATPLAVVTEVRRVLKPGGVVGLADADYGSVVLYPTNVLLERGTAILRKMRPSPDIGRRLRGLLAEAGFDRIETSTAPAPPASANLNAYNAEFWARYFEADPFIAHAEAEGWSSRDEMSAIAGAWRTWGSDMAAFTASIWCQAIGWAPTQTNDTKSAGNYTLTV